MWCLSDQMGAPSCGVMVIGVEAGPAGGERQNKKDRNLLNPPQGAEAGLSAWRQWVGAVCKGGR